MGWVFPVHLAATLYMAGVIWFAQIVHYPLLGRVGEDRFAAYERANTRRTGWVVIPPMIVELVTAVLLALQSPAGLSRFQVWLNLSLLGVIWLSTLIFQAPRHARLSEGFDRAVHRSLVRTNWVRTLAWSGRAALLLWMLNGVGLRAG